MRKILFCIAILVLSAANSFAATHYIRPSGSGCAGAGTSFTNCYNGIPGTLTRGDTYVIAGGDYGSYAFNDSGTSLITIRKANATQDSGVSGWSASYGTDQAVFSGTGTNVWNFTQGYYYIDGVTGSGSGTGADYGFKVTYTNSSTAINPGIVTVNSNMTIRNVWFLGFAQSGMANVAVHGIREEYESNLTIEYNLVENFTYGVDTAGSSQVIYQHNYFKGGYGPGCCHQDYIRMGFGMVADNRVFRFNTFDDVVDGGYTGVFVCVGSYTTYPSAHCNDTEIYGNIFINVNGGGNGTFTTSNSSSSGALPCNDWLIYNNTFVGGATTVHFFYNYSGNLFKNNLLYNSNGYLAGATADYNYFNSSTAIGSNQVVSSESTSVLFDDYAGGDYHLGSTDSDAYAAGTDLGDSYDEDPDGVDRDPNWSMGAYEYGTNTITGVTIGNLQTIEALISWNRSDGLR